MDKAELVLSMGSNYQSTAQIEKELKEFWNNLIEKQEKNNRLPSPGHPDKNSNKNSKNPDGMDNCLAKSLIIFLVVILALGGIIVIYSFLKR